MKSKLRIGQLCLALFMVLWTVVATTSVEAATKKTAKLKAPNPVLGDLTGWSLAINDGTMVVGAPSVGVNPGVAYIFKQDHNTGNWDSGYMVSATNGFAGDYFGYAAAVDGHFVAVGAPYARATNGVRTGVVYLYEATQTGTWAPLPSLVPADALSADRFGWSLAIRDSLLVVGAQYGDVDGNLKDTGAVYLFRGEQDPVTQTWSWTVQQKLTATGAVRGDQFGTSVSTDGETIVVGAPVANAAYVFTFNGSEWVEEARLTGSDTKAGDRFGIAVAVDGETLAVGAPGKSCDPVTDPQCTGGSVYLFAKEGGFWTEKTKVAGVPVQGGDWFGVALSLSRPLLVVGAPYGQIDDGFTAGYAYVLRYKGNEKQWKPAATAKLIDKDATENELFGYAVALKGNRVIVGAPDPSQPGSVSEFTINQLPVASATVSPPEVHAGNTVVLDGAASIDPDEGDVLTYHWVQVGFAGLDPVNIIHPDEYVPQATFAAPEVPAEEEKVTLTFQLTVKDDEEEESEPVTVSVVVTKSQCQITSRLGEKRSWISDRDTFTFQGNKDDTISLTLQADENGKASGKRAVLILQDKIRGVWLFRADRGALPNHIQATLPAAGEYLVTVMDDPFCRRSDRFRGDYLLTLEGASGCLEASRRCLTGKKQVKLRAKSCHHEEGVTEGFWF